MTRRMLPSLLAVLAIVSSPLAAQAPANPVWDSVAAILKTAAVPSPGYVRYNLPRRDLTVRVGNVTVATALIATSWVGLAGDPSHATAMGDLVLTTEEVKPVLAELAAQHVGVNAVHNHLVGEQPRLIFIHYHAMGTATDLARRMDAVLARTRTPRPVAAARPAALAIDTATVFAALGHGRAAGAVAQVGLMLVHDTVRMGGEVVVPAMGYGSPINIQAVSGSRAVATGDFAVPARFAEAVAAALAEHDITATAMHGHLVGEQPNVTFIHFWADGPLADVVAGIKAGVDAAK